MSKKKPKIKTKGKSKPKHQSKVAKPQSVQGQIWQPLDWVIVSFVGFLALLIYSTTLSPHVLLEDDGLFLGAGSTWGTVHPPGYPLYTVLLWLIFQLPILTPALLAHGVSALFGAMACGCLYACGRRLDMPRAIASISALLFAVYGLVWAQAVRADVYSLNTLILFAILLVALYLRQYPNQWRLWGLLGGLFGLGLANHWPLLGLAIPGGLARSS